jgi:hypothetical protein
MTFRVLLFALFAASGAAALVAQPVVIDWNNTALQAVQEEHMGPSQTARALAMAHTCMYNAWAPYDSAAAGTMSVTDFRRPVNEHTISNKTKALSYAAYRCLTDLFPRRHSLFRAKMLALGYDPEDTSSDLSTPSGIGNRVAHEIIDACHKDGSNQLGDLARGEYEDYTGYKPVNGPNRLNDPDHWQPLKVVDRDQLMIQTFLTPFWSRVTPFALTSADEFRPSAPYSWLRSRDQFIQQATELVDISAHLTDNEKIIAEYWSDGPGSVTPPGHWCRIAQFVSRRDHHDLDEDVKMFFVLTNALLDTSIAVWDAKRTYDSVRPITAIRFVFAGKKIQAWGGPGKGTQEIDGDDWKPYQKSSTVTPPFPEYVSGHSAFSAAAAEVLRLFTGSDTFQDSAHIKAGSSKIETGRVPTRDTILSWATFSDAADQAGMSRRYGGIHFKMGDLNGRKLGRAVGAQAYSKGSSYFNGNTRVTASSLHEIAGH